MRIKVAIIRSRLDGPALFNSGSLEGLLMILYLIAKVSWFLVVYVFLFVLKKFMELCQLIVPNGRGDLTLNLRLIDVETVMTKIIPKSGIADIHFAFRNKFKLIALSVFQSLSVD